MATEEKTGWLKWVGELLTAFGGDLLYNFFFKPATKSATTEATKAVVENHLQRMEEEADRARPVENALGHMLLHNLPKLSKMLFEEHQGSKFPPSDRQRYFAAYLAGKYFYDSKEMLDLEPKPAEPQKEITKEPSLARAIPLPKNISLNDYRNLRNEILQDEAWAREAAKQEAEDKAKELARNHPYRGRRIAELSEDPYFFNDRLYGPLKEWEDQDCNSIADFEKALMSVSEDPHRGSIEKAKIAAKEVADKAERKLREANQKLQPWYLLSQFFSIVGLIIIFVIAWKCAKHF